MTRLTRDQIAARVARDIPEGGLARKGTDDLPDPPRLQERGEPGLAVAGVVVDDGEIARTLLDQRIDQLPGHA